MRQPAARSVESYHCVNGPMAADLSRQESICHTSLFANYHMAMTKDMVLQCLNEVRLAVHCLQASPVLLSL